MFLTSLFLSCRFTCIAQILCFLLALTGLQRILCPWKIFWLSPFFARDFIQSSISMFRLQCCYFWVFKLSSIIPLAGIHKVTCRVHEIGFICFCRTCLYCNKGYQYTFFIQVMCVIRCFKLRQLPAENIFRYVHVITRRFYEYNLLYSFLCSSEIIISLISTLHNIAKYFLQFVGIGF